MEDKVKVLMGIVCEELTKDIKTELKEKEKSSKVELLVVYNNNTYVHLDTFCEKNIEYFGINSDNFKRNLYQKGLLDYNGSKYIPYSGMENTAILSKEKLYVNRDLIDRMLLLYLMERMTIKNIKESFEEALSENKKGLMEELYAVSVAEFQRRSPVFEEIRLGNNKKSEIDM